MKNLLTWLFLIVCLTAATAALACTTTYIYGPDGKLVMCTTCCDTFGNCTMNCY